MAKTASKWLPIFETFVKDLRISSKEVTSSDDRGVPLKLWGSQKRFLEELAWGLDRNIRYFCCLKSRQLGVTTISVAIDVFWLAMHPHLPGALVSDTDKNRRKNRALIEAYVRSLPDGYFGDTFEIAKSNDQFIRFSNGAKLDLLVAGTKSKNISWGEGEGYALSHITERASIGDPDGLASFEESLAQKNPDRLFISESTAKGFNHFRNTWKACKDDPYTKHAIFCGWWSSEMNRIEQDDARFQQYGIPKPFGEERELIKQVETLYGHRIQPEQLAWIRWKQAEAETGDPILLNQNHPWTEEQAFVTTGYSFFAIRMIAKSMKELDDAQLPMLAYRYELGNDFLAIRMEYITRDEDRDLIELKVWEQPVEGGQYVIGCDPAWGRSKNRDNHCISVWRCFADRLVQVAEYATADVEVKHCAWVLAHLSGAYRNCVVNVELGGPGRMIMEEWAHLKGILSAELYQTKVRELEWEDALGQARWYLYHRPDSMGAGYAANFECLALDTKLPTPFGWTTMGEVREGEYLLSDNGEPTEVVGLSDIKIGAKCYEIEFDDGTKIVSDEDHWWKVARGHWWYGADKLRQTKQLAPKKFYIRLPKPLQLSKRELLVDPYILGVWLGDGASAGACVYSGNQDVEEMAANIEACGQPTRRARYRTCWRIGMNDGNQGSRGNPLLKKLRALGVLNNKHIPDIYLRASFEQRLALLQGLLDTDGSAAGNGGTQCSFVTTNTAIANGFSELIRTLGFKAKKLILDESKYKGIICAPRHQFWFTSYPDFPVFRLTRKLRRNQQRVRTKHSRQCHRIRSIEQVDSVPVRCVMVDSPTKMFLAGDGMIPTHNTTWRTKHEIMHQMRGEFVCHNLEIRSMRLLREMTIVVQDGNEIGAPESRSEDSKDDRVFACALAVRAWLNWVKNGMMQEGLTYDTVMNRDDPNIPVLAQRMNDQVFRFFKTAQEKAEMQHDQRVPWRRELGLE